MKKAIKEACQELLAEASEMFPGRTREQRNDRRILTLMLTAAVVLIVGMGLTSCCTKDFKSCTVTVVEENKTTITEHQAESYEGFVPWSSGKQFILKK